MRRITPKDVTVLIPTKNEEDGIGGVIDEFKRLGYTNILVIDGHSLDRMEEIEEDKELKVVS